MSSRPWPLLNTEQKVERWAQVIRVLKALTPHQRRKHFAMESYLEETDCGTVGCAAGFCSLDPWFRRRGIKATKTKYGWDFTGNMEWSDFWGEGSYAIFNDTTRRPVRRVIAEINAHIRDIKRGRAA